MKILSITLWASVCLIAVGSTGEARAQNAEVDTGLGEIIVTAQKRAENLQSVPISATVVDSDQIEARHIYDPSQLQIVAPSLQIKSFNAALGASNFSIRGVGTLSFANSIEASVTSVIDGVVMGSPALGFMNFLDLAQIEVLNGPQGMLFGKNASAGLVNITTKRPVLDSFEGMVRGEAGWMSTPTRGLNYLLQGVVNIPVAPALALRVSGSQTHTDPIIKNVIDVAGSKFGQDQSSFRAKLLWEPSTDFSLMIAADYAHSSGSGNGTGADRVVQPGSPVELENAEFGIVPGPKNALSSYGGVTRAAFNVGGVQANFAYTFADGHSLTNILAFRQFKGNNLFDVDKHRVDVFDVNSQRTNTKQITEELRLASPTGGTFDYQIGLYYYDSSADAVIAAYGNLGIPFPPPPPAIGWLGFFVDSALDSKSYAVFGQGTIHAGDRARLTMGGRWTRDELSSLQVSDNALVVSSLGPSGTRLQSVNNENFSWRVTGQYDLTDSVMAYLSAARGYKGPGFNLSLDPQAPIVKPEIPTSFEVGIKSTLFDRHLVLNVSAYTTTFKNFQAQALDPATTFFVLLNAGELKTRGFEVAASVLPAKGLTFNLGLSYVDAVFTDFKNDPCYPGQPDCRPDGTADSSGHRLPNSPKWTASVTGRYETTVFGSLGGFVQGALYARTKSNYTSAADPIALQPGYVLFDTSVGVKAASDAWQLSVFCRNCFDKRTTTFINKQDVFPADYYQQFGLNSFRTIGISLEGRF